MKKIISSILCLIIILALISCGNDQTAGRKNNQQAGVNDILEAGMSEAEKTTDSADAETKENTGAKESRQSGLNDNAPSPEAVSGAENEPAGADGIDVDLTALSSTMVYSEVYAMMQKPESYVGKVIKMNGTAASFHDEASGNYYFACIIRDAAACCAQGIEYVLNDTAASFDDYPQDNKDITVVGIFDTYMEGEYRYCTLRNAKLI